jgi:glycosyltransferase involved in cell wall biosynthesis
VHFVGEISPDRVGEFLAGLDVFVFPSQAETFGLAAVEAASSGVPTVVRDMPVLREVLSYEGKPAALFVDASDNEKLFAAVSRILTEKDLREELRQNAKGLTSRYSVDAMVSEYARVLDDAIPPAGCQA